MDRMRPRNEELDTCCGDISEYKGPAQDFPFKSIRLLGAAQIIVAFLIELVTIVHLSLSYEDRYVFVATACVGAWTPLPSIAAGIIGLATQEQRYWEIQCMKYAFCVLTSLNGAVFMPILVFVTAIVTAAYYDINDPIDKDHLYPIPAQLTQDGMEETRLFIVGTVVALGLLQIIICISALVCACCCAPLYHLRTRALKKRLYGAHNPKPVKGKEIESVKSDSTRQLMVRQPKYSVLPQPPLSIGPALQQYEAQLYDVTMATVPADTNVTTPAASLVYIVD